MSFWRNRRVLITGADGFLGANLTKRLLNAGACLTTFSRGRNQSLSLLSLEGLLTQVDCSATGSVEDLAQLQELMRERRVEIVYHLAALPFVETGQGDPIQTFEINIGGTWNVLEAARLNQVERVVTVSSSHVYGDNPNLPYKEEYYPQPSRPYETSKACADLLAQCYASSYQMEVDIPRLVNVYGPGDLSRTRIVPKIIRTVLAGQSPQLWQSEAVRDFLYVEDAVDALQAIVEKKLPKSKSNRIFNFGSGNPVKIDELVQQIIALSAVPDVKLELQPQPADRAHEIIKQYVSIEKAERLLGWRPRTDLTSGLSQTIEWFKAHWSRINDEG